MRWIPLLVICISLAMTGCREESAVPTPDNAPAPSADDGAPGDGGHRAGRPDRPQRPELEE